MNENVLGGRHVAGDRDQLEPGDGRPKALRKLPAVASLLPQPDELVVPDAVEVSARQSCRGDTPLALDTPY